MEIILCQDVQKLGRVGEVVKVKDGFARNYLLPNKLAYVATAANLKKIESAKKKKIWVGICGEMSGDPVAALLLVGLGIDGISTSAFVLPTVKRVIRSVNYKKVKSIAEKALTFQTGEEIRQFAESEFRKEIPDFFDN